MRTNTILLIIYFINLFLYADGERRIFGGKTATVGQFPHAVLVYQTRINAICTGSIIHREWVLTAAHCVFNERNTITAGKNLIITAGVIDVNDPANPSGGQVRTAAEIYVHKGYRMTAVKVGGHDLCLIKVNKPFELSDTIKLANMSAVEWPQNNKGKRYDCVAAGYGRSEYKKRKLRYLKTSSAHGRKSCPCIHRFYILKRIVCLPAIRGEGLCFGDSGGALLCGGKIVGVAHVTQDVRGCSFTQSPSGEMRCDSKYVHGIYMYTCPYLNWIADRVPGIPREPSSCLAPKSSSPTFYLAIILATILLTEINYISL